MKDDGARVSHLIDKAICLTVETRLIWRLTSQIRVKSSEVQKARRMLFEAGDDVATAYMRIEEVAEV